MIRRWQNLAGAGAVLFVIGAVLFDVPILALCGIPLALLGLVILLLGLMAAGGGGSLDTLLGAMGLMVALGLMAYATATGLAPAAEWALARNRGGAAAWPMGASLAMLGWSALAGLAGAGSARLRGSDLSDTVTIGAALALLPWVCLGIFVLLATKLDLPLTA